MNRFSLRFLPVSLVFAVLTAPPVVQAQSGDDLFELKKNFEIFGALYEQIIVSYVDDVRPGPFMKAGMDAMMSRLDPYTRYYDQAENLDMDLLRQGTLGDIGLNIGLHMGRLTVLTPDHRISLVEGVGLCVQ